MRWYDRLIPAALALLLIGGVALAAGEIHYDRSLRLSDNIVLNFGTDNDATFTFNGTKLVFDMAADDTAFELGDGTTSIDVKWFGNTASDYLYLDASANLAYTTGVDLQWKDDDFIVLGTGAGATGDVQIEWDTALTPDQLLITPTADDTILSLGTSAATQLAWDVKWFANEASGASYLYADASANLIYTTGVDVQFVDDDFLVFGTGAGAAGDVHVEWDTAATPDQLIIDCEADDTVITLGDGTTSFDLDLFGGSAAAYISWDASANDLKLEDSVSLMFGTGATAGRGTAGDVEARWDGTDFDILAAADDSILKVGNGTASFDVWIYGETAAAYVSWDASANDLKLEDSVSLMFGTGAAAGPGTAGDVEIRWDGTDIDLIATANNSIFKIGDGTASFDLWLFGSAAGNYWSWDASANDLKAEDNVSIMFGTGAGAGPGNAGDVEIRWDGTDLDVLGAANGLVWNFGNGTNSFDVTTYGTSSSNALKWTASVNALSCTGTAYMRAKTLVTAKTAAYTIAESDYGTVFSNRGASAGVTFTLPAPAAGNLGEWVEFYAVAAQNVTITTAALDQLVVKNNATADSISLETSGEIIGSGLRAVSDGTGWIVVPLAEEAVSVTIVDN